MCDLPIAILYEHPEWFKPLFAELDRRAVSYAKLPIQDHYYDPASRQCPFSMVVNRVSAYPSGGSQPEIVLYAKQYLAHLDSIGVPVINGYRPYLVGASKAMQLDIFEQTGVRYPRARVIHQPRQALQAASGLTFPIVIKPNVGGSGAGIVRCDDRETLSQAIDTGAFDLGIDRTGLVQEFLPAEGGYIVRVEILAGEHLYSIRLPIAEDSFNYCPADGCNVDNPELSAVAHSPPREAIDAATRILATAGADLGSVEYLINQRDGEIYYYDINPLSNFVADAPNIVGFDPVARFVAFLLERSGG